MPVTQEGRFVWSAVAIAGGAIPITANMQKTKPFTVTCKKCGHTATEVMETNNVNIDYLYSFVTKDYERHDRGEMQYVVGYYCVECGRLLGNQQEIENRING